MNIKSVTVCEDVARLTTIPISALERIENISRSVACHAMLEMIEDGCEELRVYFGFGTLRIHIDGDEVQYRFEPSDEFQNEIKQTITTRESPVARKLEARLVEQFVNTYKELL